MEIFRSEGIRAYIPNFRKKPDFDVEEIIEDVRNDARPSSDIKRACRLMAPYSNISSYVRRYARSPSRQKLSRRGKSADFRALGVDIDIANCHPAMLVRAIREAYAIDDNEEAAISDASPAICRYVSSYKERRAFAHF